MNKDRNQREYTRSDKNLPGVSISSDYYFTKMDQDEELPIVRMVILGCHK